MKRHLPKHCYRKGRKGYVYFERGDVLVRMPDEYLEIGWKQRVSHAQDGGQSENEG